MRGGRGAPKLPPCQAACPPSASGGPRPQGGRGPLSLCSTPPTKKRTRPTQKSYHATPAGWAYLASWPGMTASPYLVKMAPSWGEGEGGGDGEGVGAGFAASGREGKKKKRRAHGTLLERSLGGWHTVARPAPPTAATARAVSITWWWRMGGQWRGVAVGARRAASLSAIELLTRHSRRPPFFPQPCGVATDQHGRPGLPGHTFHHNNTPLPGSWTGGWDAPGAGGPRAGKQKKNVMSFFFPQASRAQQHWRTQKKNSRPRARPAGRPPLPLTPPPLGSPPRPLGSGRSPASCPG